MARERVLARRADARRKITLGGLVIKAKLAEEPSDVLLGALLYVARTLGGDSGQEWRARFEKAGRSAFAEGDHEKAR